MDGNIFDRITKTLTESSQRREAIKAVAGTSLAAVAAKLSTAAAAATKKKRCRKRRQSCGGKKKCCNKSGLIACRAFPWAECTTLSGQHCCGLEGAACNNDFGHCDCCPGFYCSGLTGPGQCQETPT